MRLDSSRLHFRGGIRNGDVKFQIESHYDAGPTRFVLHSQPKKDDNSWFSLNEINSRLENILRERPSIQQVTFEYCLRPTKPLCTESAEVEDGLKVLLKFKYYSRMMFS